MTSRAAVIPRPDQRQAERFSRSIQDRWPKVRARRDAIAWRRTRDPWRVLVADMMLPQIQVERVVPKYLEFVQRFPICAGASAGEVIRIWSGLGYNQHGVAIYRSARTIADEHGGDIPKDICALLSLDGVGPYTARAVLAFAGGAAMAPVDTNLRRVVERAVMGRPLAPKSAQGLADSLVPPEGARDWNFALMDFGSLVCVAKLPRCDSCPVPAERACAWRSHGVTGASDPTRHVRSAQRESRFEGSDRECRGRLVRAACAGPISSDEIPRSAGLIQQPSPAQVFADVLVGDGLLVQMKSAIFVSHKYRTGADSDVQLA